MIEGVAKDEARLKIELEGKDEPVTIGLPFSLISEAKLVADRRASTPTLRARSPHIEISAGRRRRPRN